MEISRRVADQPSGCSFDQMFLVLVTSNNKEIERLTRAVKEQASFCMSNREDELAERLLHRFISALGLAVLAGQRLKQLQHCWERAILRVP